MHINTCRAINGIIDNCIVNKWITTQIDDSEAKGKGFYKMNIYFKEEGKHLIERMDKIFEEIGLLNGEGLWIKTEGLKISLS